MNFADRFERQRILPEVGASGQAQLEASELVLSPQLPPNTLGAARLYAEAMGMRVHVCASSPETGSAEMAPPQISFPFDDLFRHTASRQVASGAHLALLRAREVLGIARAKS